MIPPRAKLADLAIAAGVSTATVSRVLNGKPGVADATRTSVLATLERLGFAAEPDQPSGEGLIAVMVPELANPSFALFANELALVLTAAGRHMIICTAGPGGTSEEQYLDALLGVEIAGIISVSGTPADTEASPEHYQRLIDAGVPAVFINGYTPGVEGLQGASVPGPGVYYLGYLVNYDIDSLRAPGSSADIPGRNTGTVTALANRVVWMTGHKLLGADYGMETIVPVMRTSLTFNTPGISDSRSGVGDVYLGPLVLGWHGPQWDAVAAAGLWLDNASDSHPASPGKGFKSTMLTGGLTYYFDGAKTISGSALARYEFNGKKDGGFRPSPTAPTARKPTSGLAGCPPGFGPFPHARAGCPDRRKHARLCQIPEPQRAVRVRRRAGRQAGARARSGLRRSCRHPRPPARSDRPARADAAPCRDLRAR